MIAGEENRGPATLGSWLREAREARGESLDDVSRVSRIGRNYLAAIESDDLEKLPKDAYTRGFIRLYAKYLGLSEDEAVLRMEGKAASPPEQVATTREQSGADVLNRLSKGPEGRRWAIPLFLVLLVLVFAILLRPDSAVKRDLPKEQPAQPAAVKRDAFTSYSGTRNQLNLPAAPVTGNGETTPPSSDALPSKGIVLRLKVVQNGKLHITMDGAVSQEYDLTAGDLVEWKAEKLFILDLDNAGSVEGELDGAPLPPFGKPGEAAHLAIRKGGVSRE